MYLSAMSLRHDALYKLTLHFTYLLDQTTRLLVSSGRVVWSFIGSCYLRLLFYQIYLILFEFDFPALASPAWGTGARATHDFHFIFGSLQSRTNSLFHTWLLNRTKIKNIQACSIVSLLHEWMSA